MSRRNRILWNRRPTSPTDPGDIDELVIFAPKVVHIEQMDVNCWWIGITMSDGSRWDGNFTADRRGRMSFGEQENDGVDLVDTTHEPRSNDGET